MNEAKRHAIAAGHVFDGWARHKDAAVVVAGWFVVGVIPSRSYHQVSRFVSCPRRFGSPRGSSIYKSTVEEMSYSITRRLQRPSSPSPPPIANSERPRFSQPSLPILLKR